MRSYNELARAGVRDLTDLTDGEIKTLTSFVVTNEHRKPDAKYLEVGVFAGTTMRYVKQFAKTTHFTGVDLFEDFGAPVSNNTHTSDTFSKSDVERIVGDRVTLIKGDSHTILPTLTEKYDFIFIDGNHTYEATLKDFLDCTKLLAPGGQIAFHNASSYMGPDFELYVMKDGGPWLVTQHINDGTVVPLGSWHMIADVDRLRVFRKAGE